MEFNVLDPLAAAVFIAVQSLAKSDRQQVLTNWSLIRHATGQAARNVQSRRIFLPLTVLSENNTVAAFTQTWSCRHANADAVRWLTVKADKDSLQRMSLNEGGGMPGVTVRTLLNISAMFPHLEILDIEGVRCLFN